MHLHKHSVLVVPHHDIGLNFLEPCEDIVLDNLDSEEHGQALLVVMQNLMQINSDHVHWTVISFFRKLLDDILVHVVLDNFDHIQNILLVLLDQVLVQ